MVSRAPQDPSDSTAPQATFQLPSAEELIADHARSLYDYCSLWLGDKLATINAVRNTIALAEVHQDLYPGHEHLRAWLYAIARVHCHSQPHYGGFTTAPFPPLRPGEGDGPELTANAMGALGRREREVLELIHRHGMSVPAVGLVLGVPTDEAAKLALGAQDLVECFVTCVQLAQSGKSACDAANPIALAWLESPRRELRSRLKSHILTCFTCMKSATMTVSVPALLARLPIAELDELSRARIAVPARPEGVDIRWSQHDYPLQPDAYNPPSVPEEAPVLNAALRAGSRIGYWERDQRDREQREWEQRHRDRRETEWRDSDWDESNWLDNDYVHPQPPREARPRSMPLAAPVYEDQLERVRRMDELDRTPGPSAPHPPEDVWDQRPPTPRLPDEAWEDLPEPDWQELDRTRVRRYPERVWENRPVPRLPAGRGWEERSFKDDRTVDRRVGPRLTYHARPNGHPVPAPRPPMDAAPPAEIWERRIAAGVPKATPPATEVWDEEVSSRGRLTRRGSRARARERARLRRERRQESRPRRRPIRMVALTAAGLLIVSLAWRGLSAREYPAFPASNRAVQTVPKVAPSLIDPVRSPTAQVPTAAPSATASAEAATPPERRTPSASAQARSVPVSEPSATAKETKKEERPAPVKKPALSVRPLTLALSGGASTVTLSASAGTIRWRAVSTEGLAQIAPASGTVRAGEKVRLTVELTPDGVLASSCLFEVNDELAVETTVADTITIRWTGTNEGVRTDGKVTLKVTGCPA
ncbi:hypothetical protein [Acrocarpospora catenulata]|uniref:hypothetical protein n=1 Tax=Acrocarpospora catenulata TaxID=2836182 RepID=UPI001BDB57F0|nr:hypothetical protein [Acrocarpospora catenulata]